MTHAEAASNRGGRHPHDNYGPVIWGGTPTGGDQLRERVRAILAGQQTEALRPALQFKRESTITARGTALATIIHEHGSSWALVDELLERYGLPYEWDASRRRVLVGALDVVPLYQEDAVQTSVGWPLVGLHN